MKIKDQVVSLELAREMKELGVEQDSVYVWVHPICKGKNLKDLLDEQDGWKLILRKGLAPFKKKEREMYAAYTVAELGEMLLDWAEFTQKHHNLNSKETWYRCYAEKIMMWFDNKKEADSRAKMWIYLKKEGLIK